MIKHKPQIRAFNDTSRFKFLLTGRRGGKTFLITEDMLRTVNRMPKNGKIVYIAPSRGHAMELLWEPIIDRIYDLGWYCKPHISKSTVTFSGNRKIYILGAEKISRVRGHKFFKAYMDEVAFFTHDLNIIWRALRPTLSDTKGGAILATTPNGKGTSAYDFYMSIAQKDKWSYHSWRTIDNPFIDKQEIEDAKEELDEKSFYQEYEAGWVSFEGLAYYSFDDALNVRTQPAIDYSMPLHLCFDFNVNPTTLLLSQYDGEIMRYKKEYSLKNSSTEITVSKFCDDFHGKPVHLKIRGDATGSNRKSNTGLSDYHYVKEILSAKGFSYDYEVKADNPAIVDRLKVANSWLKNYAGKHRIEIDPSCTDLIRDLSSQITIGRHPSDKNNIGHKADAMGYDIYWQNMIATRKPSTYYEQ